MNTNQEFKAGLEGIVACQTAIGKVDGERGRLIYRGHNAVELALTKTVEEVWFLLHEGRFPTNGELADFKSQVEAAGHLSAAEVALVSMLRGGKSPLSCARTALSAVASQRGLKSWLNRDLKEVAAEVLALAAAIPNIIEVLRTGQRPVGKDGNAGYAERYLWGITGSKPLKEHLRTLETYLVLTMDHDLNASTFAARLTASSGADVGAAITSAIGTLEGPLHGGAPGPVLDMLDAVGTPQNAAGWVKGELDADRVLMGFGHRVYRVDDPRAMCLKGVAERQNGPRIELAEAVEREALKALAERQEEKARRLNQPVRTLRVNVEFWTAVALEEVGIPRELYSSTFCTSRVIGWGAHIKEQIANKNKIYRPRADYTGLDFDAPG